MRSAWIRALVVLAVGALSACGGDPDSGGVPTASNLGESGGTSEEPDLQPEPELGVCRQLCCTSADCGGTATCVPFASASGTLGVCSGAIDPATAADPPAGSTTSPTCWSANEAGCNALTSEGCAAGDACDYAAGEPDVEPVVSCFGGDNIQAEGESCDNALGPWCQPGLHCVTQ